MAAARAQATRLRRLGGPVVVALGIAAATGLLAFRSPYASGSYGYCPSVLLLGVSCPGCGALRATHDLAHGDLAGAWAANPLWVVAVPVLVVAWSAWASRQWRSVTPAARSSPAARLSPAALRAVIVVAVAVVLTFGVLRNVPALAGVLGPG